MTRILLVEDHELNSYILAKLLTKMGFDVTVAESGAQALAKVRQGLIDVILMDMKLPDLQGWEVTGILKSSASSKHIPIIGLSAYAEGVAVERAYANGCDDFDTKPIVLERLVQKISRFLNIDSLPVGAKRYL